MPSTARAQDDFNRYLRAAVRLYKSLEYERALEQVQRAKKLARSLDQDVSVALYEGIILADMGKREESRVAFKTALLLDPDAKLPFKVSPKMESDVEEIRAQIRKELVESPGAGQETASEAHATVPASSPRAEAPVASTPSSPPPAAVNKNPTEQPAQTPQTPQLQELARKEPSPPARPSSKPAQTSSSLKKMRSEIMRVVTLHKPAIVRCVKEQREQQPDVSGKLVMRWSIQPNGLPKDVSCGSAELCSTYLARCLTGLIQGWIFPSHDGEAEPVEFPFVF